MTEPLTKAELDKLRAWASQGYFTPMKDVIRLLDMYENDIEISSPKESRPSLGLELEEE